MTRPSAEKRKIGRSNSRCAQFLADLSCARSDIENVIAESSCYKEPKELSSVGNKTMLESASKALDSRATNISCVSSTVSIDTVSEYDEVPLVYQYGKASIPVDEESESSETMVQTSDSSSASIGSDTDCDSSLEGDRRKVHFSNVYIREYSLTVGDSPVMKPYALSLDWAHTPTETLDIEMFEEFFSSSQTKPNTTGRKIRGFRLPPRLKTADRFALLTKVTGQSAEDLYKLNLSHLQLIQQQECTSFCSEASLASKNVYQVTYEKVDADEHYQMVDL